MSRTKKEKVYVWYVSLIPALPGYVGKERGAILGTYAIYSNGGEKETFFPNDDKIRDLVLGKKVINQHPKGKFYSEARKRPIRINEVRSKNSFLLFTPLEYGDLEKILKLSK